MEVEGIISAMEIPVKGLSKLWMFREVKKVVLDCIRRKVFEKPRADEILVELKKSLKLVKTRQGLEAYPEKLTEKFPELRPLVIKVSTWVSEHQEAVVTQFLDALMEMGEFEKAERVMEKMEVGEKDAAVLRQIDPEVFDKSTVQT